MSKCTGIEKVGILSDGTDILRVTIDDSVEALWCYPYADAMQFLNQEVIVDYFQNIYEGRPQQFVKNFVIPRKLNVIEKQETLKLFTYDIDNQSNVNFSDIDPGSTQNAAIVFCIDQQIKSSTNAIWLELTIRDRSRKVAVTRIFDFDKGNVDFAGNYLILDLSHKQNYGFNSTQAAVYPGEFSENPEITVAKQFIKQLFAQDEYASTYLSKTMLLDRLDKVIDYERGYAVVRMAQELCLCDQMHNMTYDIDVDSIMYTILCSYGHNIVSNGFSDAMNDTFLAAKFKWPKAQLVLHLLDPGFTEPLDERSIYHNIKTTVDNILHVHKAVRME